MRRHINTPTEFAVMLVIIFGAIAALVGLITWQDGDKPDREKEAVISMLTDQLPGAVQAQVGDTLRVDDVICIKSEFSHSYRCSVQGYSEKLAQSVVFDAEATCDERDCIWSADKYMFDP